MKIMPNSDEGLLAIIPARSGSKRIKNKNLKKFNGVPIIVRTISKLKSMKVFKEIIVSTDSEEIREVVESQGAIVPFLRPINLARDSVPTLPVIQNTIHSLGIRDPQMVFCVYPTSVFIRKELFVTSKNIVELHPKKILLPVKRFPSPIERRLKFNRDSHEIVIDDPQTANLPTQDFQEFWYDISEFYVAKAGAWKLAQTLYSNAIGMDVKNHISIDINDTSDWVVAENIYSETDAI